jgi:hypothetical protein
VFVSLSNINPPVFVAKTQIVSYETRIEFLYVVQKKFSPYHSPFPYHCGYILVIGRSPEEGRSLRRPGDPQRFPPSKNIKQILIAKEG